jgi:gas vesicle protein
MERFLRFVFGLLLGVVVGAAAVVLFVPESGAETRARIQDRVEEILAEGQRAAEERRVELTTQFEELKKVQPPQ